MRQGNSEKKILAREPKTEAKAIETKK